MDNLPDLKAIWLSAKTDILPNPEEIVRMGKKFRGQKIKRKIIVISVSVFNIIVMLFVMFSYHAKLPITYIGEVLVMMASLVLITTNVRSIKRFYDLEDYNNHDLILFLERTRQNQIYFYKKTQVLAMALTSVGLLLYMYELLLQRKTALIEGYALIIIYMAVMWFVVRPMMFKKHNRKIDEMIKQLEKISKQYED